MEVCEVIAAVCSGTSSTNANHFTVSSKLRQTGRPMDVAVSVLVKLVIDMYDLLLLFYFMNALTELCANCLYIIFLWLLEIYLHA